MSGNSLGIRIKELSDFGAGEKDASYCANMPAIHNLKACASSGSDSCAPGEEICRIAIKEDGSHVEIAKDGTEKLLEKAKLDLHDCLGCNGCQTEDGSDFVQRREMHREFADLLRSKDDSRKRVLSLSPQARASLAAEYNVSLETLVKRLTATLTPFGFAHLFDVSFARDVALLETAKEFIRRKRSGTGLPLVVSSCPGIVSYAEITHADSLLPLLSTVKSPQQVMGSIVKKHFAREDKLGPKDVYHVTVMPCIDRRSESNRDEFFDEETESKEVDMVLTTQDLVKSFEEINLSLAEDSSAALPNLFTNARNGKFFSIGGGPSDGYLEFVLRFAAKELFDVSLDQIEFVVSRNGNLKETELKVDGRVVLKFVAAYGFKNMQTILRKIKQNSCDIDFLEFMACPGGCTNGGGQLNPNASAGETPEQRLEKVNAIFNSAPTEHAVPAAVLSFYDDLVADESEARRLFHTSYKKIDAEEEAKKSAGGKAKSGCGCSTKKKIEF